MTWKDRIERLTGSRIEQNLHRTRISTSSPQSRLIMVAGRELLNFCSNDYLGLANHPALAAAGIEAIGKWGNGSGASHLICGHSELHDQLEEEIARFVGAERALVFSTGYMANLSLPQTFLGRHGLLMEDKLNHASLIDAGQLSNAEFDRYPHLDVVTAEKILANSPAEQKMLLTDGVFSMDGDLAPVNELQDICQTHEALFVVDDAHGFGVLGDQGGGLLQQHCIAITDNMLMMGTLGKAAGSFGAFVAADAELIEALIQFARPYIYTTALPPAVVATSLAAVKIMRDESARRKNLMANVSHFRNSAHTAGLKVGDSATPIQPLLIGDSQAVMTLSQRLLEAGIWIVAIRPPTVPDGSARLRITLTAEHSHADIDFLVESLANLI